MALTLFTGDEKPSEAEENVLKICRFAGLDVEWRSLAEAIRSGRSGGAGVVYAEALKKGGEADSARRLGVLLECSDALILGLGEVTGLDSGGFREAAGGVCAVRRITGGVKNLLVSTDERLDFGPLKGLEIELDVAEPAVEIRRDWPHSELLVESNGAALLVRVRRGGTDLYLSGFGKVPDLGAVAERDFKPLSVFGPLATLVGFLRMVGGARAWSNPEPMACFVLDDPLISRRYGFVDFEKVQQILEREDATLSLAFIPFNARRTSADGARFFASFGRQFKLCVHGCDHTWGEFAGMDGENLALKTHRALQRMQWLESSFGLCFDKVMVFPQGLFSRESMKVLKRAGFDAAVNTSSHAVDAPQPTLENLLSPAAMNYGDFALFSRRYPESISEVAFDLFLGKPALLVEHHGFFRGGHDAFEEFIHRINSLAKPPRWTGLGEVCRRSHLEREGDHGMRELRFYSSRFVMPTHWKEPFQFCLRKQEGVPADIREVRFNGAPVQPGYEYPDIVIKGEFRTGCVTKVELEFVPNEGDLNQRGGLLRGAKVLTRRVLSEFRDNVVDRLKK